MDVSKVKLFDSDKLDLPRFIKVRQKKVCAAEINIRQQIQKELNKTDIKKSLLSKKAVAVCVGSRGINGLGEVVKETVSGLKKMGLKPFIVPAMGSHGEATADGQKKILESYGISEKEMGVPVKSSMEVIKTGESASGIPIYFDRYAASAEAVIPINRIKPHTKFSGEIESGLLKMLVIGLGNHKGAVVIHKYDFNQFSRIIEDVSKEIIEKIYIPFGIALQENTDNKLYKIEAIPGQNLLIREKELLKDSKELMLKIPFSELDLLIVDEIGKNISGAGMDTNVIGRGKEADIEIKYIVVLDLTEETEGNAAGIGMADITTQRLFNKINFNSTYTNYLTARTIEGVKIPIVLKNDRAALMSSLQLLGKDKQKLKIVRIKSTLNLQEFHISENLLSNALGRGLQPIGEAFNLTFDRSGNLKG